MNRMLRPEKENDRTIADRLVARGLGAACDASCGLGSEDEERP